MSQITGGIPFVIDGPIPAPPTHSLLSVAEVIEHPADEPDPRWQNGVEMWAYPPDLPTIWDPCGDHGTFTKPAGGSIPLPQFAAYTVALPLTCSARGVLFDDLDTWTERATKTFEAVESYALEQEISQGLTFPTQPYFTDTNATLLNAGDPTAGGAALALLEDAIGATARQGLIHATNGTVTGWSREFIVYERVNGPSVELYTTNSTRVAAGGGYVGATPVNGDPADVGQAWAFATGPVKVYKGPLEIIPDRASQALQRTNNVITFRAERNYLVGWDTALQAAVLVDWSA